MAVTLSEQAFGIKDWISAWVRTRLPQAVPRFGGKAGGQLVVASRRRNLMRPTIRLGRIAGIDVGVHWSLLVIGALLVGSLAGGELPSLAPHAHGSYFAAAVLAVVLFFASILAHELAHSVVARRQGQTVDGITLWMLGGVSKLSSESRTAGDEFRVAIAGPATTMGVAAIFGGLARAFDTFIAPGTLLPTVAAWLAIVNVVLGIFNLLPGAPLD